MLSTLSDLWSPFKVEHEGAGTRLDVDATDGGFWEVVDRASHLIFRSAIAGLDGCLDIHASVLKRNDVVLLMPGSPGIGKTTLTLELMDRLGWIYCSDDLAPLDLRTGLVSVLPKPLSVKDAARWEEFAPRWERASALPEPGSFFLLPSTIFPIVEASTVTPTHVIFPVRRKGVPTLQAVSAGQALYRLGELVSRERITPNGMTSLNGLCQGVKLAEVTYEEAPQATAQIESFLGS